MALSPDDIISRRFTVAPQGYDRSQVLSFLEEVAADYGKLAEVSQPLRDDQSDGDPFRQLGDRVAEILTSATRGAEELQESVAREALELRTAAATELGAAREEARRSELEVREQLEIARELRASAEREAAEIVTDAEAKAADSLRAIHDEHEAAMESRAEVDREAAERIAEAHDEAARRVEAAGQRLDQAARLRADAERDVVEIRESLQREAAEVNEVVRVAQELQAMVGRMQRGSTLGKTDDQEVIESAIDDMVSDEPPGPVNG